MYEVDRRYLLSALGSLTAAGLLPGRRAAAAEVRPRNLIEDPRFPTPPFTLGVAAGDPDATGFVIWTRLAPLPLQPDGGMMMAPVPVAWEVAADPDFRQVLQRGEAIAHPELAHSVHVEVAGLAPARPYWYRFTCGGERSGTGRGATLPLPGAPLDRVRFAVAGCQQYEEGYYTAWRQIAAEPIDFVFHYGDYIYEGPDRGDLPRNPKKPLVRRHIGHEIYSIGDYRQRYAQYKSDPDLQAAHAAAPWFVSFDDHEIDNNWAGDIDQDDTAPEVFRTRRAMAMQAYYEHMPLRRSSMPDGSHMQMYRGVRFGDLMDAFFLDTRQYRSDQVYGDHDAPQGPDAFATDRSITGAPQEAWLFKGLDRSKARWNLIAQQVCLMNLGYHKAEQPEQLVSMDQWSGYMNSRRRLLAHIDAHCPGNVMTVSGDAHRHYAGDLIQDHGNGKIISSEYLATSISSGADGVGEDDDYTRSARADNPHLKALTDRRGYVLCDVNRDTWRGDLKVLDTIATRNGTLATHASFVTERGRPGLQRL